MRISLDTETHLIERAKAAPRPVCASWCEPGKQPGLALVGNFYRRFVRYLEGQDTLIGVNIAYDMAVLGEYWPDLLPAIFDKYERGQIEDISLNEKLLRIAAVGGCDPAYSMESLARIYDVPCPDKEGGWRLRYAELDGVPLEEWPTEAIDYPLGDATTPLAIDAKQQALNTKWTARAGSPVLHLAGYEAYKHFVLHLIECWGIHTDPERTRAFHAKILTAIAESATTLYKAGLIRDKGKKKGVRNIKAARAHMLAKCAELGIPPAFTKTKLVSLDKEACESMHDPVLSAYSTYTNAVTLRARADDLMRGFELPLQVQFDSLLETGRTSTSKPKPPLVGVQAQNFPRKAGARECLTPRPGHVFIVVDVPTAESRSLAQVCIDKFGFSVMADRINAGEDIHTWFASVIRNVSYEEMLRRLKSGNKLEAKQAKEDRQQAKPCNFGFPGGMGAPNFAGFAWKSYKVRFTLGQAQGYRQKWLDSFREMPLFFNWIGGLFPEERQYALVKHLRSGRWRGRVTYCAACNTQFQELTAMGASWGLIKVCRECYAVPDSPLWNCRPVLYTHDEIVAEAPIEGAQEAGARMAQIVKEEFNKWHPDVPIKDIDFDVVSVYTKG